MKITKPRIVPLLKEESSLEAAFRQNEEDLFEYIFHGMIEREWKKKISPYNPVSLANVHLKNAVLKILNSVT